MAFCWQADDGPTLNAGLIALWFFRGSGPVLQGNRIFLWFFRGGGGGGLDPLPPILWICPWLYLVSLLVSSNIFMAKRLLKNLTISCEFSLKIWQNHRCTIRGFIQRRDAGIFPFYSGMFPLLLLINLYRVYRQILSNHLPTLPWYPDAKKVNETPDYQSIKHRFSQNLQGKIVNIFLPIKF